MMNNPFYSWRENPCNHIWQDGACTKCNSESLAKRCPEVAKEWADTDRNREISNGKGPAVVSFSSHKEADWKCSKCGHTWAAAVKSRCRKIGKGNGCGCGSPLNPNLDCEKCGSVPLSKKCPEVAAEWADTDRNREISNGIGPAGMPYSSHKEADWECRKCGHTWEASINSRCRKIGNGNGCGCGSNINPNINCEKCGPTPLSKQCPEVAKEWADTNRNKEISNGKGPAGVPSGSEGKADWKCSKCGHTWIASIKNRCKKIGKGRGCGCGSPLNPNLDCEKCGSVPLSKQCPEVAKEWADTLRNSEISNGRGPTGVSFSSNKEADWKCNKCGHTWAAPIDRRCKKIGKGTGCGCKQKRNCSICGPSFQQKKSKWDEVFGDYNE